MSHNRLKSITEEKLQRVTGDTARYQGEQRQVRLRAPLAQQRLLTSQRRSHYDDLRG
jgi:hypothetical protein